MAGSIISGLFVAAITNTPLRSSSPSISVSSWLTTLSEEVLLSEPLLGHKLSSSSKNMTHGAEEVALLNNYLTAFSDSPTYLLSSSGPFMEMKFALDSFDTALATKVLPQPGGPYSKTPAGADSPIDLNLLGLRIGSTILILSSSRTGPRAPTSVQDVLGTVEKPSR
jgi:hypothetical protein